MSKLTATIVLAFFLCTLFAQEPYLLSSKYSLEDLQKIIIPQTQWTPFPRIDDRKGWSKADPEMLQAYIVQAEGYLNYKWPSIPASTCILLAKTGNQSKYETICHEKRSVLGTLLLAEIAENKGRFIDQIIDGVWSFCEDSW